MSEVQRFWSHEASNIRCVREADFDRVTVERDALQQRLTAADEREAAGIAFVARLIECAGEQPSIATGYLRDILDVLKPAEAPYAHSGEDDFGHREREQ